MLYGVNRMDLYAGYVPIEVCFIARLPVSTIDILMPIVT